VLLKLFNVMYRAAVAKSLSGFDVSSARISSVKQEGNKSTT
jgi:hypothetical protein